MDNTDYDRLLHLLTQKSFMYSEEPSFRLASGKLSSFYVNCKKTMYDPEGINIIGRLVFEKVKPYKPDGIGGLTLGADPIAVAVAAESFRAGEPFNAFVIRKKVKEHGTQATVEGDMAKGQRVVILEDVITTGESALTAVRAARDFGLEVVAVIALVDRQEGGRERFAEEGLESDALYSKDLLLNRYREIHGL